MTFEEYKEAGRARYAAFADAIQLILARAIAARAMTPHAITGRAKAVDSLAKKLADRKIDPASAIDEELKDLAGARVVFLTNGQVDAFNQSGMIWDLFEVVSVNVHHPVPGTDSETRLFDSTNWLVRLKPDRAELIEYSSFAGLKAEIQVQTLLNHAWAEMGHDTIYKEPAFAHVGEKRLALIKERMDRVMRDHLLPAGHDFEKIARDFHQLVKADQGLPGAVDALTNAPDNEALSDAIGALDELILPQLDEPRAKFLEIEPALVAAVERTRGSPSTPVQTSFGSYPGKSGEDIARRVSRLYHDWRYTDPERTFAALVRLYGGATTDSERKIWSDLAGQFAAHNLDVWKRYGAAIPQLILDGIDRLEPTQVTATRGLLVAMLGALLSPEVTGMTATSTTVTMQQAHIAASEQIVRQRSAALDLLERLLDAAENDAERRTALAAMRKAGSPPMNGSGGALLAMVMRDATRILTIETARASGWGLELRRTTEVDALHVHYRFRALGDHLRDQEGIDETHSALLAAATGLRDLLETDLEYCRYKVLVGHDSVRPGAWEGRPFEPDATRAWRADRFAALIAEIDDTTVTPWTERLRGFIAAPPAGRGELRPLGEFAQRLAREKPAIAITILHAMDDGLAPVLVPLLLGLDEAGERGAIERFAARWEGEGRFLAHLGDYLRGQAPFDVAMLETLAGRAIELGDDGGALAALGAAAARYETSADPRLVDHVFLRALAHVDAAGKDWLYSSSGFFGGALLGALDAVQAQRVLDTLVRLPDIGHEADMVLGALARRHPGLVLDLFGTRIRREPAEDARHYDPIPSGIDALQAPLAADPALLIAAARDWHDLEPSFHQYRGGRLLRGVSPALTAEFARPLSDIVRSGDRGGIGFVLATLLAFEGDEQLYPLSMEIVDQLEPGDALLGRVSEVLGQTGVTTGEFGFVEAAQERRRLLDPWRDDPRPGVAAYARERQRQLDQSIASEQRRAERDVEQRKRDWGEA